jgi:uncharacterized membrane protein
MQNPPPGQPGKSSTGLDENVASLISYVGGWLSGLIFFLIEKESRLVRFHAMQSILFNVIVVIVWIAIVVVAMILTIILGQISDVLASIAGLITFLLYLAIGLVVVIVWVMCLIKAYQSKMYKLPIIGNYAEKFSAPK